MLKLFFWPLTTSTESVDFWLYGKNKMPKSLFETTPKSLKLFGCLFESRFGPFCGLMSVWVVSGTPASSHIPNTCVRLGQLVILT